MSKQYLQNRELLKNIHLSKASYTYYIDGDFKSTKYMNYDIILCDPNLYDEVIKQRTLQEINRYRILAGLQRTSVIYDEDVNKYLTDESYSHIYDGIFKYEGIWTEEIIKYAKLGYHNRRLYENNKKRIRQLSLEEQNAIDINDIVIRVMSYDHIPDVLELPKTVKGIKDTKVPVNFHPYKHFIYNDGNPKCVALSHYNKHKEFSTKHGNINNFLANAFKIQSEKVANKPNWCKYSYREDMIALAVAQLVDVGLKFNEMYGENPFAYYTTTISNSFKSILSEESAARDLRDELLRVNNYNPSIGAQIKHELSREEHWNDVLDIDNNSDISVTHYEDDEETTFEVDHTDNEIIDEHDHDHEEQLDELVITELSFDEFEETIDED